MKFLEAYNQYGNPGGVLNFLPAKWIHSPMLIAVCETVKEYRDISWSKRGIELSSVDQGMSADEKSRHKVQMEQLIKKGESYA